jgi:hypothetical protein
MKNPTNIQADNYSPHGDRVSVGWVIDGLRYHVWMNVKTKQIDSDRHFDGGTIYKNPPLDVERNTPGHFNTRYLAAKKNAATLAYVLAVVERDGLIQQAIDEYNAEEAKKLAEYAAAAKIERIKEAGPELLEALRKIAGLMESGMLVNHPQLCAERRDENGLAYDAAYKLIAELDVEIVLGGRS